MRFLQGGVTLACECVNLTEMKQVIYILYQKRRKKTKGEVEIDEVGHGATEAPTLTRATLPLKLYPILVEIA